MCEAADCKVATQSWPGRAPSPWPVGHVFHLTQLRLIGSIHALIRTVHCAADPGAALLLTRWPRNQFSTDFRFFTRFPRPVDPVAVRRSFFSGRAEERGAAPPTASRTRLSLPLSYFLFSLFFSLLTASHVQRRRLWRIVRLHRLLFLVGNGDVDSAVPPGGYRPILSPVAQNSMLLFNIFIKASTPRLFLFF